MIEGRPFEEYKEMIKDMRKEEMIKGLYDLSKNVIEKENEIERLKELSKVNNQQAQEIIVELMQENEKLHSIIKEVREYIENINNKKIIDLNWELAELLEILDKENI